jgi:hypothetical protein
VSGSTLKDTESRALIPPKRTVTSSSSNIAVPIPCPAAYSTGWVLSEQL